MYTFTQRCVQDLAWVIHSPPLISGKINNVDWWNSTLCQREYVACLPILHRLDTNPAPLLQAIATAKSKRLGHYFEALLAYWLSISPNYELLLCNHQLYTEKKTLGELDFLLRELTSNKIIHLEVSVKFYLGTDDLNDMSNWHGPGLKDRLDRKFQHLCSHQTQLAQKHPELMPHAVDESACLLKGRLFYPAKAEAKTNFTSDGHLFGRWHELPDLPRQAGRYTCLGKDYWLATIQTNQQTDTRTLQTMLPNTINEATLYSEHSRLGSTERGRFFLLPEGFWKHI